jgi:hypothetical protein
MANHFHGQPAGAVAPTNDKGPTVAAAAPGEIGQHEQKDSRGAGNAAQALRAIQGEAKAREYLARLQAQQADPDELALIVAMLYGATLRGFCRVIARAIGGAA